MDSLNLQEYEAPDVRLEPEPREYRSPTWAFLMSLVLPGAGQYYCGKKSRGIITFLFTVVPPALVILFPGDSIDPLYGQLVGIALIYPFVLYPFSFLDAYFTAREINAGQDYPAAPSPRVAAILNLLTNGIGYIYVGWRRTGIFTLVALGLASTLIGGAAGLAASPLYPLFPLSIAIGLAAHAYWIAKRDLEEFAEPVRAESDATRLGPEGLSPIIPVGLAGLFGFVYLILIVLGLILLSSEYAKGPHQTKRQVGLTDEGQQVIDPGRGLEMVVPADWEVESRTMFWLASASTDKGCWVRVTHEPGPVFGTFEEWMADLVAEIEPNADGEVTRKRILFLDGSAQVVSGVFRYSEFDTGTFERRVYAPRNAGVYLIHFNANLYAQDDCAPDFDLITEKIVLP